MSFVSVWLIFAVLTQHLKCSCVGDCVCECDGCSTYLCAAPVSTNCCMPFYNYVSSLYSSYLSFSLLSHLSHLRPLFSFSNSIPLIHFYGSLCSCLLSRPFLSLPLISFFLFDLSFLISSLICITPLGFMLTLHALPMMTVIVPPFAFLFQPLPNRSMGV